MKRFVLFLLVILWLVLTAIGLAIWWISHPETALNIPGPVWKWLVGIYKPVNTAEKIDLAFFVSVAFVYSVTFVVLYRFRGMFRQKE